MKSITTFPSKSAQAASLIKGEIESLGLVPGQRLITARKFAEKLDVSKQVVQSAFALLEKDGVIETRARSGTYVAKGALEKIQGERSGLSIGLLLHSDIGVYGMSVIKAIYEYAAELSLKIITVSVRDFGDNAIEQVQELRKEGCLAVMIPWTPPSVDSEVAYLLENCKLPLSIPLYIKGFEKNSVKLPEMWLENTGSNRVTGDSQLAMHVCEYYRKMGETNIVLIGTDQRGVPAMEDKIAGYSKFMERHGLKKQIELLAPTSVEMDKVAGRLAKMRGNVAIIASGDAYAMHFMTAMHKLGLSAPHDFKIVGDNNTEEGAFCSPPLTSARADFARIAAEMVKSATAMAQGVEWHSSWMGPKELIIRESCGSTLPGSLEILKDMQAAGIKISFGERPVPVI